ncbi:hypothetical protein QEG98_07775 [Myxococcus sp. MxC21-1]|uniref:hypothetical protein n=1 Tax=Myxococcus sp. MxC21-1 TaxID=3041439 RepID=UPI002930D3D4|nr:hypothetical protein [Myxococcus sp. MxC21-1]WNZ63606.1 hypothetical protein QEG98_07775 [Myxococcus sp. MxC21-1]
MVQHGELSHEPLHVRARQCIRPTRRNRGGHGRGPALLLHGRRQLVQHAPGEAHHLGELPGDSGSARLAASVVTADVKRRA